MMDSRTESSTGHRPSQSIESVILVVEDDPHFLDLMCEALQPLRLRHRIMRASTLAQARRAAEAEHVAVFVLDVHLPDGTGLDFLQEMRGLHPSAKAVAVTGTALIEDRDFTLRLGLDRLLRKPFRLADFCGCVEDLASRFEKENLSMKIKNEDRAPALEAHGLSKRPQSLQRALTNTDVIQLKCISGASCRLVFNFPDGRHGEVFLARGNLVHASTGKFEGAMALNEIVGWSGGTVKECEFRETVQTINGPWERLLLDALRLKDDKQSGSQPV